MIDMGKKHKMDLTTNSPSDAKERISYPSFSISGDKIPDELANAKVGDTCTLQIVVKKVSDSVSSYDNNEQRVELEIHKLGYKGKKLSSNEYKNLSSEDRDKADEDDVLGEDEE